MEHRIGRTTPKSKAPGIRRKLLTFLAFAYLFVGLVHPFVCPDEAFALAIASGTAVPSSDSSDDTDSPKLPVVAEHCLVCAPVLMPALAPDAGRSVQLVQVAFTTPRLLLEDHPRLDTPPPKHLT